MKSFRDRDSVDWKYVEAQLDQEGYAVLPGVLRLSWADSAAMRIGAHVESLASEQLGRGELFRLPLDLPPVLQELRAALYRRLAPIANRWSEVLGMNVDYPAERSAFEAAHRREGQMHSQGSLTALREGDYLALHQRLNASERFPMEVAAVLNEPHHDFAGGEFVMVEQRPRMQSRPIVVPLRPGNIAVISTAQRPQKGASGHYRVNLKHAISRVSSGERIGLELLLSVR
jgi:hypothetical protein